MTEAPAKIRLDKWLWQARFFRTRGLSAKVIQDGQVRVNGTRVAKPSFTVAAQDVLTFSQASRVRVVRIEALGKRRGPAAEAQTLYEDLSPPATAPEDRPAPAPKYEGKGRPTKRDRRKLDDIGSGTLD